MKAFDPDRLIPAALRAGDAETLRRARMAIYVSGVGVAQALIFIPTFALRGFPVVSVCIAVAALLLFLLPLTLRMRNPLPWAGLHVCVLGLSILTVTGIHSGGLRSPSLWWMCVLPVVAMLVSGKRLAVVMGAVQVTIAWLFHRAEEAGYAWPQVPDPYTQPNLILTDIALLMVTLVALAWAFEKAKARTLQALAAHNQELQLVLNNVGQGFLRCDPAGQVIGRHSAIVERWFGPLAEGQKIWTYLGGSNPRSASAFEFGWSAIIDDVLPIELLLDQLPKRFQSNDRWFQLEYQPVKLGEALMELVIVVTDITAIAQIEQDEAAQRELADALDHAVRDRAGFVQFIEEGEDLVSQLDPANPALKRVLHTIKGNCGFYGAHSVANASHLLEERLGEGPLDQADLDAFRAVWRRFCERVSMVIDTRAGIIEINPADYRTLSNAVQSAASPALLSHIVTQLRYEPVELALNRCAAQARDLAHRLSKGDLDITVETCDIRLDPRLWKSVWSAFVHAIRNAIDHGLEDVAERQARRKPPLGRLHFSAEVSRDELVIAIEDDGRGIDWIRVAERAQSAGIPYQTQADLVNAVFWEGLSTRDEANHVSGRGIGLGALREAVTALGGSVELSSEPGVGTKLGLHFPSAASWAAPPAAVVSVAA